MLLRAASALCMLGHVAGVRDPQKEGGDPGLLAADSSLLEANFSASVSEDGLACCCRKAPPEACEYLAVEKKNGKEACCYASDDGCPFFSKWWTSKADYCIGKGVSFPSKIRAHKKYDLLDPKAFPEAMVVPPQGTDVEPLGVGGYGYVYLARDRQSGEPRALKMAKNLDAADRFRAECANVKAVNERAAGGGVGSQHLIRCFEADLTYDPTFIALEYAGEPPWRILASADYNATLRVLKQLFLGLHAFEHSNPPTVHHDIKWENVVVAKDGCLKIIDLDTAMAAMEWILNNDAPSMPYTKGYSKSGAVECGRPRDPRTGRFCPLAYSYDAHSAGIVTAGSLCGIAEWRAYYKAKTDPDRTEAALKEIMKDGNFDMKSAVYQLGFKSAAGHHGSDNMESQIRTMQGDRVPRPEEVESSGLGWFAKGIAGIVHEAFERKLQFCESLLGSADSELGGALAIVDRLREGTAAKRPRPEEVLQSPLFRGLATGCAGDGDDL